MKAQISKSLTDYGREQACLFPTVASGFIKYVILLFVLPTFIAGSSREVLAQTALERKIDSLFVIASSGEVKFQSMVKPAIDSIAAYGAAAVPPLIDKLNTKSPRERITILEILKKIGRNAVPYLINALDNTDGVVVQRLCTALGDIADSSAVEPLIEISTHGRWQVREEAIGSLGDIGSIKAEASVLAGFTDSVGEVRKSSAVASSRLHAASAIPMLVHQLNDDFYGARMAAMEALLLIDTTAVTKSVSDSIPFGGTFLKALGCEILGRFKTNEAMDILMNWTKLDDTQLRAHAAVAVVKIDPDDNCGFHSQLLENESDRLNKLKIESAIYSARNAR